MCRLYFGFDRDSCTAADDLDAERRRSTASRSMERDSAGIEPGQCDGREPPIGLGAEERMVDTKAVEVVVEEGDRLV